MTADSGTSTALEMVLSRMRTWTGWLGQNSRSWLGSVARKGTVPVEAAHRVAEDGQFAIALGFGVGEAGDMHGKFAAIFVEARAQGRENRIRK